MPPFFILDFSEIQTVISTGYFPNSKTPGKISDKRRSCSTFLVSLLTKTTRIFGLKSARTWRQIPHGKTAFPFKFDAMTIASKSLYPAVIAEKSAVLSAQLVAPKEEFSTLTPVKIVPSVVTIAAPTAKLE